MTVYLDIIFIENVCMNYIIIYATAILLKTEKKVTRIFVASIIGALYAIVTVIRVLEIYNSIIVKIIISLLIMYVAIDVKNIKELLKATLVFYLVSFIFGGIALALLYFVKPENILMKNGVYIGSYPIKIVLLGGILGYILISIVYSIIRNNINRKKRVCNIEVCINNKIRGLNALIDSGNFLREPITGLPVIVVEVKWLFELIPKEISENIDNILLGKFNIFNNDSVVDFNNKIRVIPFSSLGKENGMLLGIKTDYIKILGNEETKEKIVKEVIVGLYDKTISKERKI